MYEQITGKLVYKTPAAQLGQTPEAHCVLQVGDALTGGALGYQLLVTQRLVLALPPLNPAGPPLVTLYTHLLVKPEVLTLVGFLTRAERDLFILLLGASGVGAKMALALLDCFNPAQLVGYLVAGEHKPLTQAKGVGAKLAQKLVLELKDKATDQQALLLEAVGPFCGEGGHEAALSALPPAIMEEVEAVLASLGYLPAEIHEALKIQALNAAKSNNNQDSEGVLQGSLRWLAQNV